MSDIRLRIELLDTDPLVWRRMVVPEQINLHRLHELIQDVMGWADCHLYEFECSGRYYGEPDEWSDRPIALARNAKLKSMAARAKGGTFHYLYDFGDGWEHRIVVEATGLEETNPCPRLIDGAMACPPEDVGGTGGYAALKAAAAGERMPSARNSWRRSVASSIPRRWTRRRSPLCSSPSRRAFDAWVTRPGRHARSRRSPSTWKSRSRPRESTASRS